MRSIFRPLLIFRPLNLLLIGAFQLAAFYFLNFETHAQSLNNRNLWFMVIGLLCVTAAGYAINDWFDRIADRINKPNKVYIDDWSIAAFWSLYALLNTVGIILSFQISNLVGASIAAIILSLFLYSYILQRIVLIGNVVVSLCTAFAIFEVYLVTGSQNFPLVIFFTIMAFLLTMCRELVKDIEDVEGDKVAGYRTFPVLVGERNAQLFAQAITFFTLVLYLLIQYQWIQTYFSGALLYVYYLYQSLCVMFPLWYIFYKLGRSESQKDFRLVSNLLKYAMLTGVGSMLLF